MIGNFCIGRELELGNIPNTEHWWTGSRVTATLAGDTEGNERTALLGMCAEKEPQWSSLEDPKLTPSSPPLQGLCPALRSTYAQGSKLGFKGMNHSETLGVGVESITIQSGKGRAPWEKFLGDLREWIEALGLQVAARSLPSAGEALGAMPGPTPNTPTH